MKKISITIPRLFGWEHLPALTFEIDATVEAKLHLRAAVTQAVSSRASLTRANLIGANLTWASLTRANLDGANLIGANLTWANLDGANLTGANLTGANLTGANLDGATLTLANLTGASLAGATLTLANLTGANLTGASLTRANLTGASLTRANLTGANLDGETKLLCSGDMQRIHTMQFDTWRIGYTATHLQIGCQRHELDKWRKWNTPAGKKWIAQMDTAAAVWADRNLALVLALIDANPAT